MEIDQKLPRNFPEAFIATQHAPVGAAGRQSRRGGRPHHVDQEGQEPQGVGAGLAGDTHDGGLSPERHGAGTPPLVIPARLSGSNLSGSSLP